MKYCLLFAVVSFIFSLQISIPSQAQEAKEKIQLQIVSGLKYPNSVTEGVNPVRSFAFAPVRWEDLRGFNELLPYVTPAPDQEDANSCMLMSLTGVVEWWMRKLNNVTRFVPNDNFDLSERWWMNLSEQNSYLRRVRYWFTDAIYLYNEAYSALNRDYPFAKGWYIETEDEVVPAQPNQNGAEYGVRYSWHDAMESVQAPLLDLPLFSRRIILKDENEDPWAIGVAPADIVDTVIAAFQKYKAPIQVIYNHEGFWHSVYVIGYDEEMSSENCGFINHSLEFFRTEAEKAIKDGQKSWAKKMLHYQSALSRSLNKHGGCHPKGMFYVRDSQYSDASEEMYIYDPKNPSANKPYSKRIVLREFDWLRTMANHISIILPRRVQ